MAINTNDKLSIKEFLDRDEQKDLLRQFAKTFNSGKQEVQESSSSASKSKKSSSKGEGVMDSLKSFFEDLKK